jgi:hypothetical protein
MRGFLVLLVFAAVGLFGVLQWRKSLQAPREPVVAAGASGKEGKGQRHRRRRGARRLARNEVFAASSPASEAPAGEAPVGEARGGEARGAEARGAEAPMGAGPAPVFAPSDERAPLAPGGASTTEMPPSPDILGELAPTQAQAPSTGGGRRQPVVEEPEPIKLRAADLKIIWQGEDLSRAETVRLDFSKEGGHELSQDEIDARFRAKEDAVLACIARARPDQDTYVPGRVTVRFRIERNGSVKAAQVEAPVILHRGGLTGCIKGVVSSLRFPASGMSQVITYPFSLI